MKGLDIATELEGVENDAPAVLQLHSWGNYPLPVSAFVKAALSPSRTILLLKSHDNQALLLPLGGPSNISPVCSNPLSGRESSFRVVSTAASPATPLANLSTFRTISSPGGFQSTPYGTPLGDILLQTTPATPYFTPLIDPLFIPSNSQGKTPSSAASPISLSSLPYPLLCDVNHFAWASHGDGFGLKGPAGPFKELLFTSNQDGLFIHGLTHKYGCDSKDKLANDPNGSVDRTTKERTHLDRRKREGKWRNWRQSEPQTRLELRRRLDESVESEGGDCQERSQEQKIVDSGVETVESKGKRKQRVPVESPGRGEDEYRNGRKHSSNGNMGLMSYVVDAELQNSSAGLQLKFNGPCTYWPSSAQVVSFKFAANSPSFSLLTTLDGKKVLNNGHRASIESNSGPKEGLDLGQPVSSGWNPDQGKTKFNDIVDIISSPSNTLIGIVTCQQDEGTVHGKERLGERQAVDERKPQRGVLTNALVSIAGVLHWGIKWISFIQLDEGTSKKSGDLRWVSLVLASDRLLGLTEKGGVFVWAAVSGSLVAFIDVVKHCGLGPAKPLGDNVHAGKGMKKRGNLQESSSQESRSSEKDGEASPHALPNGEGQLSGEGSLSGNGNISVLDLPGSGVEHDQRPSHQFRNLIVTANCLLLAVADDRGVLFLVSTDDYFASQPSQSSSHTSSAQKSYSSLEDLKVLSYWGVAGSDIGGSLPTTLVPDRQWLKSLHEEDVIYAGELDANNIRRNGQEISYGRETGPGPPVQASSLKVATGFTSRMEVARYGAGNIPVMKTKKPTRRVFLPYKSSEAHMAIALSLYAITTMIRSRDTDEAFTIRQNALHTSDRAVDERDMYERTKDKIEGRGQKQSSCIGNNVAFSSQGLLYIVTSTSLHVVLPPLAMSSSQCAVPVLDFEEQKWRCGGFSEPELDANRIKRCPSWQVEVLDRALVCDGLKEAEVLCLENGWSVRLLRLRRLQLALDFVRAEDVEQALEALGHVGAADSGVLCVLFIAVELILNEYCSDNELAQASRLLSIAASFTARLVRQHGMKSWDARLYQQKPSSSSASRYKAADALTEMARFLEVIRSLQDRLQYKRRGPHRQKEEIGGDAIFMPTDGTYSKATLESIEEGNEEITSPNAHDQHSGSEVKAILPAPMVPSSHDIVRLAPSSSGTLMSPTGYAGGGGFWELSPTGVEERKSRRRSSLESPGDMFARWENESVDAAGVVRDALKSSGRLALAVAQLHRLRMKSSTDAPQNEGLQSDDVFSELLRIGRGIVYELFCRGKTALAMAALRRLGEDIEIALRELALGSISRFLRPQAVRELQRLTRLSTHDFRLFERVSLIEKAYPSNSFWKTYAVRRHRVGAFPAADDKLPLETERNLGILCDALAGDRFKILCGEVDGVVLGSWSTNVDPIVDENAIHTEEPISAGYWAAAAVWLQPWDQLTVDRILLERPLLEDQPISWEAKLDFNVAHHNWPEVAYLLETVPSSLLCDGELHVQLDCDDAPSYDPSLIFRGGLDSAGSPRHGWSDDVEKVEAVIPRVQILDVELTATCSTLMWQMIEERLVKNHIFLRVYWKGTVEIVSLLARGGLLFHRYGGGRSLTSRSKDGALHGTVSGPIRGTKLSKDAVCGIHELVVQHCVRHTLPHFLQLYIDFHLLGHDKGSASIMQALVADCQWGLWLLFSGLQRYEYEASFANARAILSPSSGRAFDVADMDNFLPTIHDMAETGGEIMALSTLMYAPVPLQKCLCSGSVSRQEGRSWQCTLESLKPGLQGFPTLWKILVAACHGHDTWGFAHGHALSRPGRRGEPTQYLQWRQSLFSSASCDTSLLQMIPRWVPRQVRRLLQLTIQGPAGDGQLGLGFEATPRGSTSGERASHKTTMELLEKQALSWEATIQKSVVEELHAPSSEATGLGCEHHLRRGHGLAAFKVILGSRVQSSDEWKSGYGHLHPSEIQALFMPLTAEEEKLIAPVVQLAILHYDNPVVVSACTLLIELCGLSANLLQIDIAALIRISDYFKSEQNEGISSGSRTVNGKDTTSWTKSYESDVGGSLSRALADEYLNAGIKALTSKADKLQSRRPGNPISTMLQLLEKATLKDEETKKVVGASPGAWLISDHGDGSLLRATQRSMSERWSLVTAFCRAHHLPLSITYLTTLARDNDWVGFLAEAQLEGCPLDTLLSVVSKEFTDARLQSHLLLVLNSLPGASEKSASTGVDSFSLSLTLGSLENMSMNAELFSLLADCERMKRPGKALLAKARELRWSLLAVVASCFPDVTPHSCLTTWLEVTAVKETSVVRIADAAAQLSARVGAAVEATNALSGNCRTSGFRFSRKSAKRRRRMSPEEDAVPSDGIPPASVEASAALPSRGSINQLSKPEKPAVAPGQKVQTLGDDPTTVADGSGDQESLAAMVAVLCEQQRFLPLLRAFELFTPASPFLPFLRFLQAFSQMRISEASAHLAAFTSQLKEETQHVQNRSGKTNVAWITKAAIAAADAMYAACPSAYERRCFLQLLSGSDFGDGGMAAMRFRQLYWKIQLADPALREGSDLVVDGANLDDDALLDTLERSCQWEQARSWARQLDLSRGGSALHHVTETQAEAMVAEWKELLWDVQEERVALWNHCQALFIMHAFPASRAGEFFLKHANSVEPEVTSTELHNILLLALQWLSGSITNSPPVYPLHLLHELETRVWLLAVESSEETQDGRDPNTLGSMQSIPVGGFSHEISSASPIVVNPVDRTAATVAVVDSHLKRSTFKNFDVDGLDQANSSSPKKLNTSRFKRRQKEQGQLKWSALATSEGIGSGPDGSARKVERPKVENNNTGQEVRLDGGIVITEDVVAGWEEKVGEGEAQSAVLALLEVGQLAAAKQLQQKLTVGHAPLELSLVEAALKVAALPPTTVNASVIFSTVQCASVIEYLQTASSLEDGVRISPVEVLEILTEACRPGCGRGLCHRISAVARIANILDLTFSDAFSKPPTQLLQLLALKGQDTLAEAKLLVATHSMLPASVARILAESFLKGLLAAHRGGYMESSQKEEGPAPLLWRPSDFIRWAQVCPSEPEIGHALMRLVISGRDMPHACEVELIILAHRYYESSACLDGVDVLVALAATRVDSYMSEGDYSSLARLVTGISNFEALRFILDLLIENGQLELLLQKRLAVDAAMESSASIRGFRMAVLSALKHFNPHDLDAFALVYSNFSMAHEMAALLESRGLRTLEHWAKQYDPDQSEESLDMMSFFVEAAEVYSGIDAGNKTRWCCAQASLVSLQLRMPEHMWLNLSDTNARRLLVDQPRFQESLIVAEAYGLNQSAEWVPVIWNQMLVPGRIDQFLNDFVAALPLTHLMLMELARFYRAEVSARGDQNQLDFSKWLTPGGVPVELARHLSKSFRSLMKHTRDMKERLQLATVATGFPDVVDLCLKNVDNMPVTAGPLILRKGHGGTYVPIM